MKPTALGSAIRSIVWAEVALTAALGTSAYAQTTPVDGSVAAEQTGSTAAAAPAPASGTAAGGQTVKKLDKFEVTGSLIRTSDKVGHTEVQVITAKEIQQSGYTTVADFLRSTSANSASSWGQTTMNSSAPGGAGMALRGLSEKYTLVLVDGQRVANYAQSVNFTDTFFDVNAIPLNMVERVEIVKTGAVSVYGSDAIAGVVNIITKKNFQGLQIDGQLGKAQHPGDGQGNFSVLAGFGDLNSDRFNVTAAASYYRDSGSTLGDRDMTSAQDFTQYPGGLAAPLGPNQQSYWSLADGSRVPLSPCPPGSKTSATNCTYNPAASTSLVPSTTRLNAKVRATFKIDDNTQAYAGFWVSRDETVQLQGPASISSTTNVYNPSTGSVSPLPRTVPVSNPYNPFGVPTAINLTFPGNVVGADTVSTFWMANTGVKGSFDTGRFGAWDWSADYGHSQSTVDTTYRNRINVAGLENMLANGTYNFSNPAATPNGLNGVFTDDDQQAISKVDSVTAKASTSNLFTLPGGPVGLGLGTEFRHESSTINPQTLASQGVSAPANVQTVEGSRNVAAAFYQVDIPILRNLTFTQAGRYDHYSDFGGAFSPSFALRFQPVQMLTTYASYSRGFRAPTLVENSQAVYLSHQNLVDPNDPSGVPTKHFTTEQVAGNPNLQPEHTKNYNIGFQLSPDAMTDIGAAFYKVRIDGVIGTDDPNAVLVANDPSRVVRNADGSVRYLVQHFVNLGALDTDGFDLNFRKALRTKYGTFTLAGDWTYVWHFKLHSPGTAPQDFAGNNLALLQPFGASNPRWKGNTSVSWDYRQLTTTLTWQYTGPYTNAVAAEFGDGGTGSVASYSQFNLMFNYRGFKHWTIYGGITNLFDKKPPFDVEWQAVPDITGYDQSLYTNLGRFFQVGATYRF
ncbi:TonB-dependent receptor [Burkholderia orbicola]|uniref:TonB-dependent receptor n=3 Tax=Burkholderia cepacia complex TaxID=87882 RepID=A0AAD0J8J4_9BURK|nr:MULTISPECIES: TonB-dependent receptor [Burkholderia cepacia complex]EAY61900.1 TonB-dependent receptor [Burkholderia cenocepacia PC184]ESS39707.1 TonB-dependent receptor [Burkholderia cenocepacia KC-01]ABK08457.1 TonB-dependent receptor [Burkholderia cenocepacia HI2424]AQQ26479.1 TonB-dependent receptor [Burkholderia cenocepacia]AQT50130.1 TonB-dependent receptor [Burkholderia cenocepacia]